MCDCDLEKWLCDVTGVNNVDGAKSQVSRAIEVMSILPRIGTLTMLISPVGVLDTTISQKLVESTDSLEMVELALLNVQQGLINTRRQLSAVEKSPPSVPEKTDTDEKTTPKKRRTRKKTAPSDMPEKEKVD